VNKFLFSNCENLTNFFLLILIELNIDKKYSHNSLYESCPLPVLSVGLVAKLFFIVKITMSI
jgi:hypothetical protein